MLGTRFGVVLGLIDAVTFSSLIASLLTALALLACRDDPAFSASATEVHTDADELAERILLPEGVLTVKWIVSAVGSSSSAVPGPTDTTLVAYLTLSADAWKRLSVSGEEPTKLRTEHARALLPLRLLEGNQAGGDFVELSCRKVNADLAKSWYVQLHAVRCGDGLLSVFRSK